MADPTRTHRNCSGARAMPGRPVGVDDRGNRSIARILGKEGATPPTEPCSDPEVVAVLITRIHAAGHGRGDRLELLFVVPVNDEPSAA